MGGVSYAGVAMIRPVLFLFAAVFVALCTLFPRATLAQTQGGVLASAAPEHLQIPIVRTDAPGETLKGFFVLRTALEKSLMAYFQDTDREHAVAVELIADQMIAHIDLSDEVVSSRHAVGMETLGYLLDIMGRIPLPDPVNLDAESRDEQEVEPTFRIPGTPLRIVRILDGPDSGQYLFGPQTVRDAPAFYQTVKHRPLRSGLNIESWHSSMRQLAGPMIPSTVVATLPEPLKRSVLGTPIWKVIFVLLMCLLTGIAVRLLHWLVSERTPALESYSWLTVLSPAALLAAVLFLRQTIVFQIIPTGLFSGLIDVAATILGHLAMAWLVWTAIRAVLETSLRTRKGTARELDANLLRMLSLVSGVVAAVIIIAHGLQNLGLPIASILTGLGIGGLAIALAIRPTLENLIGGFVLFLDKPIRVGDWCSFGETIGVVEQIGVRSIQIRARDRTLITIPNAQFADMQIVNRTRRDRMLIDQTVGLRYETTTDQLYLVLAGMRETCHAHPAIDSKTVRIRFAGYGDFALLVEVFIFAKTNDVEEFHAIREDILIRFQGVVQAAGTGFAFPSRTIYFAKDPGLDADKAEEAAAEIQDLREAGTFPFPRFSGSDLERLEGAGDYPPQGSPEFTGSKLSQSGVAKTKPDQAHEK